jgi:hypothetical protein
MADLRLNVSRLSLFFTKAPKVFIALQLFLATSLSGLSGLRHVDRQGS